MRKLKITEISRLRPEAYSSGKLLPITLVLDNLRSMHNVGSIFRSADAFRLERIILCGITARPPHPDIHKTALGAEDAVPWVYYQEGVEVLNKLRSEGYQLYALEQASPSISLTSFVTRSNERYALIVGNEVHGVRQELIDLCDGCLEIPQFGSKHSLNVSVATGIALWHMAQPLFAQLND